MIFKVFKADDELCEMVDGTCNFQNGKESDLYKCLKEGEICKSKKICDKIKGVDTSETICQESYFDNDEVCLFVDDQNNPGNKKCELKKICNNIGGPSTTDELCNKGYVKDQDPNLFGCVLTVSESYKYCRSAPRCELINKNFMGADEGFCSVSYYDREKEICIFFNDPENPKCVKKTLCSSSKITDCSSGYVTKGENYKCGLSVDGKSCMEKEECSQVTDPSETNCASGYVSDSKKECKFNSANNKCEVIEKPSTGSTTKTPSESNNSKILELSLTIISLLYF